MSALDFRRPRIRSPRARRSSAGPELRGPCHHARPRPGRDSYGLEILRTEVVGIGAEPLEQAGLERSRIAGQLVEVEHRQLVPVDVLEDGGEMMVIPAVVDQLVDLVGARRSDRGWSAPAEPCTSTTTGPGRRGGVHRRRAWPRETCEPSARWPARRRGSRDRPRPRWWSCRRRRTDAGTSRCRARGTG